MACIGFSVEYSTSLLALVSTCIFFNFESNFRFIVLREEENSMKVLRFHFSRMLNSMKRRVTRIFILKNF